MTILQVMSIMRRAYSAVALLLLLTGSGASAQSRYVGIFNSMKGMGVSYISDRPSGSEMLALDLYVDMFGVFSGRTRDVGLAADIHWNYVIDYTEWEYASLTLYSGPGFLLGYVHDYEKHFFSHNVETAKKMGAVAALSGDVGLLVDFFDKRLSLDLRLCINPGLHIRRDNNDVGWLVAMYKRGIYYAFTPQLNICYRF